MIGALVSSRKTGFRRTGADLPFGDPRAYHGTALEGYFWRFSLPHTGDVIIVMASVNRDARGARWGTAAIAAHPGVGARVLVASEATGAPEGLGIRLARAGRVLVEASGERLAVDLGADMRLHARIDEPVHWPRRALGGLGIAHVIPGLSQYWHPHLLGGRVSGWAILEGREVDLDGGVVYAEKNWGPGGFPDEWWWGQAHGFGDPDVCVAFAGGSVRRGRLGIRATAVVARVGPLLVSAVHPVTPVRTSFSGDRWLLSARTRRYEIEIDGDSDGSVAHRLPVPVTGAGEPRHQQDAARQHLAARMHLTVRRDRRVLFAGDTQLAGLELGALTGCASPTGPLTARA